MFQMNINNDAEAHLNVEAGNEEKSTKIDAKKLFKEIYNFRDDFSLKNFAIVLLFGLIPSGWDSGHLLRFRLCSR